VAAQPIDCAGDERAAPQAIGAEHCARRRTTRHLRWVDGRAGRYRIGSHTIAHIIQVALTSVFLLSGIATLLNVFSTRLARRP
jgi:hypothetical protein